MSKNIFKIILLFILLFCLSNSAFFVYADTISKRKIENTAIDLTYADMEAQFANNVFITKDDEFKVIVEKDLELEDLLAKCKKKGLKIGLALGGGSARGLAHVGVILALEAYNIPIDIIAGTSIGSVIGGLYASGATIRQLEEVALSIKKSKTLFLIDPVFPHSGLISGDRIEKMLNQFAIKDKTFDDLSIPFAAVATEIENGAEVIINQGKVIDAVRASISIPGIFTPVKYQDYYLVDGGVVNPVPVDVVQMMGADIIIAVSLAKINPYTAVLMIDKETGHLKEVENLEDLRINKEESPKFRDTEKITPLVDEEKGFLKQTIEQVKSKFEGPNIFEIISQSTDIMESKITDQSLEGADIVIVPFGIKEINLFDFDKAEMLIKGGIMAGLINIPGIKRVIKEKLRKQWILW
ncbi:patatin-like phospholipase family protein [bacterium]|nr:patatin-like phospholipase family protein [bacterium]MBU4361438.1 patatin-like phospholipase family protein [bacterium]MBU4602996.1 patatin-like phospholipase family protein [bacterium]MCG2762577.1 patatin-like phospholipase family protein [Candidatus Atribacteria bacterium]